MLSFFKKKTDPKAGLQKALSGYSLPSFPAAIMQTLERIRDPEACASSVADALSVDPGLSVRVLRLANSAAFSARNKVENLSQAIALVGFSQLETMVLSVGVSGAMPGQSSPGYDAARFWRASARRGVLAHFLASIFCPARGPECFTAGFLQDMAVPLLAAQNPDRYGPILEQWRAEGGDLCEMEREVYDWDHAEVATWMCNEWDFPENITAAIGGHHGASYDGYDHLAPVSLVAWLREDREDGEDIGLDALTTDAISRWDVPIESVRKLIEPSFEKGDALAQLML
jgi:HD-like signal output (HDOD) protein